MTPISIGPHGLASPDQPAIHAVPAASCVPTDVPHGTRGPRRGNAAGAGTGAKKTQNMKKTIDLTTPADLYLGSDHNTARAQGHRHFRNALSAIRFAMEQAAPVSLRGAMLRAGGELLDGEDIRALYHSDRRFARRLPPEVAALNAA